MAKKIWTKIEAIRLGYYLTGEAGTTNDKGLHTVRAIDEWDGNWKVQDFTIHHDDTSWHISASRRKHKDGRIRDAHSYVEGEFQFALWFVRNYPNADDAKEMLERAKDPANLAFSVDCNRRKKIIRAHKGPLETIEDIDRLMAIPIPVEAPKEPAPEPVRQRCTIGEINRLLAAHDAKASLNAEVVP